MSITGIFSSMKRERSGQDSNSNMTFQFEHDIARLPDQTAAAESPTNRSFSKGTAGPASTTFLKIFGLKVEILIFGSNITNIS